MNEVVNLGKERSQRNLEENELTESTCSTWQVGWAIYYLLNTDKINLNQQQKECLIDFRKHLQSYPRSQLTLEATKVAELLNMDLSTFLRLADKVDSNSRCNNGSHRLIDSSGNKILPFKKYRS